jgi:hypothetical protein
MLPVEPQNVTLRVVESDFQKTVPSKRKVIALPESYFIFYEVREIC